MITDLNHILIFKTNIQTECDRQHLQNRLDTNDHILQWNIDLQDVDRVLRIISKTLTPQQIISIINHNGFECAELE